MLSRAWLAGAVVVLASAVLAAASPASAQTLVLVQGYRAGPAIWHYRGIAPVLASTGIAPGEHLSLMPDGSVVATPGAPGGGKSRFVTIDLPTEAPIAVQAAGLARYLFALRAREPGGTIVLVGHSAGGVVARLAMVMHPDLKVARLVTIASPNLGTPLAELGTLIGHSPLAWFAPLMNLSTINRSQALYHDLARERPGNLLGWLNRQPHPPADYVAIIRVRNGAAPHRGDSVVEGHAQDLNTVPALAGRARTLLSPGDHDLRPDDGLLIAELLRRPS